MCSDYVHDATSPVLRGHQGRQPSYVRILNLEKILYKILTCHGGNLFEECHRFTRCTTPGIIYPSFSPFSTPLFSTISSRKPEQFSKSVLIASEFWNLGFHFWLFEVQSLVVSASLIFCCILQQIVCTTVFRSFSTFHCLGLYFGTLTLFSVNL